MKCWKRDVDMLGYASTRFQTFTPHSGVDRLGWGRVGCVMMDFARYAFQLYVLDQHRWGQNFSELGLTCVSQIWSSMNSCCSLPVGQVLYPSHSSLACATLLYPTTGIHDIQISQDIFDVRYIFFFKLSQYFSLACVSMCIHFEKFYFTSRISYIQISLTDLIFWGEPRLKLHFGTILSLFIFVN